MLQILDKDGKQGCIETLDRSQVGSKEFEFTVDTPKKATVVVKGPDGKPMAGLLVWPVAMFGGSGIGMGGGGKTDERGETTWDGLWKGGVYQCDTFRKDVTASSAIITIKGDGTDKLEINLEAPSRTQHGLVVDAVGKPVARAWVWASALKGATTETDADGRFTLTGLPSAPVEINAYNQVYARGKATASRDTPEVVIKLDK